MRSRIFGVIRRNTDFPHNIYVKIFKKLQNQADAENFSDLELKFLSNVNHPENCVKVFEFLQARFAPNQDPTDLFNSLKNDFGVGLRFLVTSAIATANARESLPPKIAKVLNQVNLLDFLKMQGVVKNPNQMLGSKKVKVIENGVSFTHEMIGSGSILKIGEANLESILKFLAVGDVKYKSKISVDNRPLAKRFHKFSKL